MSKKLGIKKIWSCIVTSMCGNMSMLGPTYYMHKNVTTKYVIIIFWWWIGKAKFETFQFEEFIYIH